MSNENTRRDDEDLESFLARQSSVTTDYANLELVEPPPAVDEKLLAAATASARSLAAKPAPDAGPVKPAVIPATKKPLPAAAAQGPATGEADRRKRVREPVEVDDEPLQAGRPRWLIPAALAATVLVAVGIGVSMFGDSPSGEDYSGATGKLLAKRARDTTAARAAAEAAAQASARQDAEDLELEAEALPPPPIFEPEGPQVQDLDAAIALIRRELVLANQIAAVAVETPANSAGGKLADSSAAAPPASTDPGVIQPRNRRLAKILELFDGGNEDLAADSLEIFLRDFADDPISQRILAVKP